MQAGILDFKIYLISIRKKPEVSVSDEVFVVPPPSPECQDARHHWKVTETVQ